MNDDVPTVDAGAEVLGRIVESSRNLVLLDTADSGDFVERLRLLTRRSGQSLYLWKQETGLLSLREGDLVVPGCRRLTDALRFIRRSMHFGIYLLQDVGELLRPQDTVLLAQIARLNDGPARRVVLMGPADDYSESLRAVSLQLSVSGGEHQRPRLRDGRWVR
ncbi:MAG TPA: hypothetical protein VFN09_00275 [Rhodanobacteraceae bacterium]|nr:hypothetical protein [Rhodanobacteraceae bacterium]